MVCHKEEAAAHLEVLQLLHGPFDGKGISLHDGLTMLNGHQLVADVDDAVFFRVLLLG